MEQVGEEEGLHQRRGSSGSVLGQKEAGAGLGVGLGGNGMGVGLGGNGMVRREKKKGRFGMSACVLASRY